MAQELERKTYHYDSDDEIRSQGAGPSIYDVVEERLSRRNVMRVGIGAALMGTLGRIGGVSTAEAAVASENAAPVAAALNFEPIKNSVVDELRVPRGYQADVLIRWGDGLRSTHDRWTPGTQDPTAQAHQFGYNNDFIGYLPLPYGSKESEHGLLAVNHEYPNPELMFAGYVKESTSKSQVEVMCESVGMSVVEVKRDDDGTWRYVHDSRFNARYTATTEFEVTGPARGHDWMKTSRHATGTTATGTLANCSAGKTPWGTVLSGEENFQDMFSHGEVVKDPAKVASNKRYGIPAKASEYGWELHDPRFDLRKEENENYHFGWVIEIDPYDPDWKPKKRTSLGRFRHEAATTFVSKRDQVVMYSGCDGRFEYIYKFVCSKPYDRKNRLANRDILDEGTLYVAKLNDDGSGVWLPLTVGTGPLTAANGFRSQGDVVINARLAADLLGATKMDRPEDIEVNPVNKKVYVVCTNNVDRGTAGKAGPDKANPRAENRNGHIVEMTEDGDDHGSLKFRWELFLVCGDPKDPSTYFAGYDKTQVAAISCPDNVTFDQAGNLWIATDGMPKSPLAIHDGLYAVAVAGPERGKVKQFMSIVRAAELCGPEFTPDGRTLFAAIQHPGEGSTFEKPSTTWPGFSGIPRPSIIAVTQKEGKRIGA